METRLMTRYRTPRGQLLQSHITSAQSCRHMSFIDKEETAFWLTRYHFWRHLCIREIRRMERTLGLAPRSSRDWVVTTDWIDPGHHRR